MSRQTNIIGALGLLLVLVGVIAGLYFFTDRGREFVDGLFDKSMPTAKTPPVTLMPPLRSQMTIEQVLDFLDKQSYTAASSSNRVPKLANVPAKELDTLTVESFKHFEVSGVLTLEFLNGSLYEVVFNPYIASTYTKVARERLGLRPDPKKNGRSEKITGRQRISSNVFLAASKVGESLDTKAYVIWQDLNLLALRRQ